MAAMMKLDAVTPVPTRILGWGLLFASLAVMAQTASDRLESGRNFDDVTVNRIQEDSALWRQLPEAQSSEPKWRAAEEAPRKYTNKGRATWGYDSTYEELRDRRYEQSGSESFDYSEERSGTLFRYKF